MQKEKINYYYYYYYYYSDRSDRVIYLRKTSNVLVQS